MLAFTIILINITIVFVIALINDCSLLELNQQTCLQSDSFKCHYTKGKYVKIISCDQATSHNMSAFDLIATYMHFREPNFDKYIGT